MTPATLISSNHSCFLLEERRTSAAKQHRLASCSPLFIAPSLPASPARQHERKTSFSALQSDFCRHFCWNQDERRSEGTGESGITAGRFLWLIKTRLHVQSEEMLRSSHRKRKIFSSRHMINHKQQKGLEQFVLNGAENNWDNEKTFLQNIKLIHWNCKFRSSSLKNDGDFQPKPPHCLPHARLLNAPARTSLTQYDDYFCTTKALNHVFLELVLMFVSCLQGQFQPSLSQGPLFTWQKSHQ